MIECRRFKYGIPKKVDMTRCSTKFYPTQSPTVETAGMILFRPINRSLGLHGVLDGWKRRFTSSQNNGVHEPTILYNWVVFVQPTHCQSATHMRPRTIGYKVTKRLMDVFLGGTLALLTLPIQICIFVLSLMMFRGRPFFTHVRPGMHEKPIKIIKFRTMRDVYGNDGQPLPDALRLTAYGKFLRRTSMDELPQLWLVVWGTMSLVGPRPLLSEYLPLYNPRQKLRHNVKPGITGWAQVSGRNDLDWPSRLELDARYAENPGLLLDIKILLLTVCTAVRGQGTGHDGNVPKFDGQSSKIA
jgi:lipopolysaccharide/colanic/teichoic acid biosynthesis glycosyltransferase